MLVASVVADRPDQSKQYKLTKELYQGSGKKHKEGTNLGKFCTSVFTENAADTKNKKQKNNNVSVFSALRSLFL